MLCPKCGKENQNDAILCVQCGVPLNKRESPTPKKSSGSKFWRGLAIGIVAIVAVWVLIGVFGRLTCETPASVTTNDATGIAAHSATLNGDLTDFNDAVGADVSFQWGTSSKSYPDETDAEAIETAGSFSFDLIGLASQTTYYYRAKADCGGYGTTYGKEKSFTTP
jgi:hypothetical protein